MMTTGKSKMEISIMPSFCGSEMSRRVSIVIGIIKVTDAIKVTRI